MILIDSLNYPQALPMTDSEIEDFLKQPNIAVISSHNRDGTIHSTSIYYKYYSQKIIMGTQEVSKKVRNIKKNPNVTLFINANDDSYKVVIIYGTALVEYKDVIKRRIDLLMNYMSEKDAQQLVSKLARFVQVIINMEINKIISFDYSK